MYNPVAPLVTAFCAYLEILKIYLVIVFPKGSLTIGFKATKAADIRDSAKQLKSHGNGFETVYSSIFCLKK